MGTNTGTSVTNPFQGTAHIQSQILNITSFLENRNLDYNIVQGYTVAQGSNIIAVRDKKMVKMLYF